MIYYLYGEIAYSDLNTVVIDVGGVGYKCTVSGYTLGTLTDVSGKTKLYTYMSVREDNVELFGFCNEDELEAFKLLISVSGVGPKAAMAVLSLLSPAKFSSAVRTEDTKLIAKAQGVGPKTAARIVLELKDKVGSVAGQDPSGMDVGKPAADMAEKAKEKYAEALDALLVLGYTRSAASSALDSLDVENTGLEKLIRLALAKLMK